MSHRFTPLADYAGACLALLILLGGCRSFGPGAAQIPTAPPSSTQPSTPSPKLSCIAPRSSDCLAHPYDYTIIAFTPSTSYLAALRLVTDLGLQPVDYCLHAADGGVWQPVSQESKAFTAGLGGEMGVWVTPDAPRDWLQRLIAVPQIQHLNNSGGDSCFNMPIRTLTSQTGSFLGKGALTIPIRVQFAPEVSYDQALEEITNLGFRLINVCAEHAPSGTAWQPAGQESVFAASHALEIATTFASSTLWQAQLNHAAGVTRVQADDTPVC